MLARSRVLADFQFELTSMQFFTLRPRFCVLWFTSCSANTNLEISLFTLYLGQWPFRKTGTMGMLTSQAEIDVWVQAPGLRESGVSLPGKLEIVYAKSCNPVHFLAFLNTLTMGTAFPRVPPRNDP